MSQQLLPLGPPNVVQKACTITACAFPHWLPNRQRSLLMSIGLCFDILAAEFERCTADIRAHPDFLIEIFTARRSVVELGTPWPDFHVCGNSFNWVPTWQLPKHIRASKIADVSIIQPSHSESSKMRKLCGHVFCFLPPKMCLDDAMSLPASSSPSPLSPQSCLP